jgi:hypothetical protein
LRTFAHFHGQEGDNDLKVVLHAVLQPVEGNIGLRTLSRFFCDQIDCSVA